MITVKNFGTSKNKSILLILSVFFFAFIVRLFVLYHTYIINPDGVLYIHQARAIYFREWNQLFNCGLNYLSIYPFLIALFYPLADNWHLAARLVSFLFGFAALIPIFLLFKRFFCLRTSLIGLSVFSLIPNHVSISADAMREPVAWFFFSLGLLFFVMQKEKRWGLWLLVSSVAFIFATWARIEFLLIFLLSGLYLIFAKQPKKSIRIIVYCFPIILFGVFALIGLKRFDASALNILRITEIFQRLQNPLEGYSILQDQIRQMTSETGNTLIHFFLPEVKNYIWLVALGALLNRIMEAFFYPFFLFFLFGFWKIREKLSDNQWVSYFLMLVFFSLIMLYSNILRHWMIDYRFIGIVIFPAFLLIGYGLENIFDVLTNRYKFKEKTIIIGVLVLILIFGLAKNLKPHEMDKFVYRKIAQTIRMRVGHEQLIRVIGINTVALRYVRFYLNENVPGTPCLLEPDSYYETVEHSQNQMTQNNIKYLLWEENSNSNNSLGILESKKQRFVSPIGEWYHQDTGRLILFEKLPE